MDKLTENTEKYLQIMDYRNTFFVSKQSMSVLSDILFVILGLDENGEPGDMASQISQNNARKILARLGIIHNKNRFDIIQALAALPLKKEGILGHDRPRTLNRRYRNMKKWIVCLMVAVFALWGVTLFAAEAYSPGQPHRGYIGYKASGTYWPWYRMAVDELRVNEGIVIKTVSGNISTSDCGALKRISFQGVTDVSFNMANSGFSVTDGSTNGVYVTSCTFASDASPAKVMDVSAPAGYVFYGYESGASSSGGTVRIAATSTVAGAMPQATMVFCRKNKICVTPGSNTTITGR